jgi:hypothetical protein
MGKVFVACALGCLFGCGAKNGAAENTTSADAIKTPATVEQAASVRLRSWAGNLASREGSCELTVNRGESKGAFDL